MGISCSRAAVIDAIPDKSVMLEIVDRIVAFEEMLKRGEQLTRQQERDKRTLESVAREMKRVQKRDSRTGGRSWLDEE